MTPVLTDHSAYDAYMLLIEGAGKRISTPAIFVGMAVNLRLVDAIMNNPPADVDVLLTEGTNLGSDKPIKSEIRPGSRLC